MAKLNLVMCFSLKLIHICTLTILFSVLHISENLCVEKIFRLSPLHNDLEPVDHPTKKLKVSNKMLCSTKCYYGVTCTGFFYRYDGTCSLFSIRFHQLYFVKGNGSQGYEAVVSVPLDCYDVMMMGYTIDGVYTITPRDNDQPIDVWCDIKSKEGWMVIQRRTGGSEDFYKNWSNYTNGFGDLSNEFWLGNANIHRLTRQGHYDLKIELEDFDGKSSYALYNNFIVSSEQDNFRLIIGNYSGNADDGLGPHNGSMFSTKDKDMDTANLHCAEMFKSGWWFAGCFTCNLNGQYYTDTASGIFWHGLTLKKTAMKIRPMN